MLTPEQIQQYRTQYKLDQPAAKPGSSSGPDLSGQLEERIANIHAAASGKTSGTDVTSNNPPPVSTGHKVLNTAKVVGNALTSSEQTLGRGLSTVFNKEAQKTAEDANAKSTQGQNSVIAAIKAQTNPDKKQHLIDFLKRNWGVDYKATTAGDINPAFNMSNKEVIGAAAGTALDVASFGSYGKAARGAETGVRLTKEAKAAAAASEIEKASKAASIAKNIETVNKAGKVTAVTQQVAKPTLTNTLKTIGQKTAVRAATGAATGYGYDVSSNLQQGKTGADAFKPGAGTFVGAALPIAGGAFDATKAITKAEAPRFINSLIKPKQADFSYGKDPGRTVAAMGITGNNLPEFADHIHAAKQDVGSKISKVYSSPANARLVINAQPEIAKIDAAIADAAKGGRNNQELVTTLQNIKDSLLYEHTVDADGKVVKATAKPRDLSHLTPEEAFQFKQQVADHTQFTGRPSDDKTVNATLKNVYGGVKEQLNSTVGKNNSEIIDLNQKYADLTSAEIATRNRDHIVKRSDMISTTGKITATASGLATAIATGGAAIPVLLASAGAAVVEKALESTAVKTRVAAWLGKEAPGTLAKLFTDNPKLREIIYRTFPKLVSNLSPK